MGSQGGDGKVARQVLPACLPEFDFCCSYKVCLSDVGKFDAITWYSFTLLHPL